MRKTTVLISAVSTVLLLIATAVTAKPPWAQGEGPYEVAAPAFDISAAPDGSIMVAGGTSVQIIKGGGASTLNTFPIGDVDPRSVANGVVATGSRNAFAATGGADEALDAAVWHVNPGGAQMVGDITAFETSNEPDAAL